MNTKKLEEMFPDNCDAILAEDVMIRFENQSKLTGSNLVHYDDIFVHTVGYYWNQLIKEEKIDPSVMGISGEISTDYVKNKLPIILNKLVDEKVLESANGNYNLRTK